MPFVAIVLAVAVALGGGASIAANGAVPGDALYPLKINVNEKVEAALSFSDEAKAETHLEAIEARHAEAKELQAQGKLSAEAKANLNANIEAHGQGFATALAHVRENGDEQAVAQLEAKLNAALNAAATISASADANANANANVNSNSQGSATGTTNSASTSGNAGVKVDTGTGVNIGL